MAIATITEALASAQPVQIGTVETEYCPHQALRTEIAHYDARIEESEHDALTDCLMTLQRGAIEAFIETPVESLQGAAEKLEFIAQEFAVDKSTYRKVAEDVLRMIREELR